MWDLIVSVPDHCLSFCFTSTKSEKTKNNNNETNEEIMLMI